MRLDFYYWGAMCPLNIEMCSLLERYRDRIDIRLHDVSENPELAKALRMFFPTLTVVECQHRFFSPLRKEFLDCVSKGRVPAETPYRPKLGDQIYSGEIAAITAENYHIAGACVGKPDCAGCGEKARQLQELGIDRIGYMNLKDGRLLGGAEAVPSLLVPYDIPKDGKTAFLTCVYLSDGRYDYKTPPLTALERELSQNYRRILAVSDECGVFPNGDLAFFERNHYQDLGVLSEETGYCTLHLMEKTLNI